MRLAARLARNHEPLWMQRTRRACFAVSLVLGAWMVQFIWRHCPADARALATPYFERVALPEKDPFQPLPAFQMPAVDLAVIALMLLCTIAAVHMERGRKDRYEPLILFGGFLIFASYDLTSVVVRYWGSGSGYQWPNIFWVAAGLVILAMALTLLGLLRIAIQPTKRGKFLALYILFHPALFGWVLASVHAPYFAQPTPEFVVEDLPIVPGVGPHWQAQPIDRVIELSRADDDAVVYWKGVGTPLSEFTYEGPMQVDPRRGTSVWLRASREVSMPEVCQTLSALFDAGADTVYLGARPRPWIHTGSIPIASPGFIEEFVIHFDREPMQVQLERGLPGESPVLIHDGVRGADFLDIVPDGRDSGLWHAWTLEIQVSAHLSWGETASILNQFKRSGSFVARLGVSIDE